MISKITFIKWLKDYIKEARDNNYSDMIIGQDIKKKINEFEDYLRYSIDAEKNWEEKL